MLRGNCGGTWGTLETARSMRLLAGLVALLCAWVASGETTIELNGSNAYVDIAELVRR
eukprot:COSAG03_NODE_1594_length_3816_cov_3.513586_2_plen_58_part_00